MFHSHVYKTTVTGPRTERHELTCTLLNKFFKSILILSFILQTPNTNILSMKKHLESTYNILSAKCRNITFNKIHFFIVEIYYTRKDLQMSK